MLTPILNIKQLDFKSSDEWPDGFIYIGRANRFKRLKQSKWANLYRVNNERQRFKAIGDYARRKLLEQNFRNEVKELIGKTLVCWCYPLGCHGNFLWWATIASNDDATWQEFEHIWLKSITDERAYYDTELLCKELTR